MIKYKSFVSIVVLTLLLPLFSGCVKNNPLPVYLEIDEWKLEANPSLNGKEGDLVHNFNVAAVYIGDKILGFFELPCKIPILEFGNKRVTVSPAIMDGGRSMVKIVYPFTEYYYLDMNLESGKTYHISPVTRYNATTIFGFVEDFESASLKLMTDPSSTASLFQTQHTDAGKSGYKGVINLHNSDSLWLGNTFADMILPKYGQPVYLEIEYRNTADVSTGMISINSKNENTIHPNIAMNKQKEDEKTWKKIYIDLGEIVSNATDAQYFELYFKTALPTDASGAKVEIDNIKVVHF
ncbi:MAG TPA: hypothetical protein PLP27_12690 [Crocinitomicaceae bacterium]|nr:hypothetical protein [Crocinitomicaceae bacterium]